MKGFVSLTFWITSRGVAFATHQQRFSDVTRDNVWIHNMCPCSWLENTWKLCPEITPQAEQLQGAAEFSVITGAGATAVSHVVRARRQGQWGEYSWCLICLGFSLPAFFDTFQFCDTWIRRLFFIYIRVLFLQRNLAEGFLGGIQLQDVQGGATFRSQTCQMDPIKRTHLGQGQIVLWSNPQSAKSFPTCWVAGWCCHNVVTGLSSVHSWFASSIPVIWGVRRPLQHEKHDIHVLSAWSMQRS